MKKSRVIIVLATLTSALVLVMVLMPGQEKELPGPPQAELSSVPENQQAPPQLEAPVAAELAQLQRREKMQQAYASLEQDRRRLHSTANMLKSLSWGLELPSEQARQVNNAMRQSYAYLKNPAKLGAYYEVADIERESRKIEAMLAELKDAELMLNEVRESR